MGRMIQLWTMVLLGAALQLSATLAAEGSEAARPGRETLWQVEQARVVAPGQTVAIPEGLLSTGYVVRARARSAGEGAPFPEGVLQVTLSAFSPTRDMPGQKAGRWYLRGDWTLTDSQADPAAAAIRHNPHLLAGTLTAELDFNPVQSAGELKAQLFLQKAAMRQRRVVSPLGRFAGNQRFEGSLYLPPLK